MGSARQWQLVGLVFFVVFVGEMVWQRQCERLNGCDELGVWYSLYSAGAVATAAALAFACILALVIRLRRRPPSREL